VPFLTAMGDHIRSYHLPVLLTEVLSYLITNPKGIYLDGTIGGGGHAESILGVLDVDSRYIGLDQDIEALRFSENRLKGYTNISYHHNNFADFDAVLMDLKINTIDGILLDLGLSSHQIESDNRGFSYKHDTPLDMRMDQDNPHTAADLLNTLEEDELKSLFYSYGEERKSRQIAKQIINNRNINPIHRSDQLRHIIDQVIPARFAIKSYARIFQALRIAVNRELESLERLLKKMVSYLNPGGRCVIISYHSLEDRIVKNFIREKSNPCTCPPEFPVCNCGRIPELRSVTTRAVKASENEIRTNSRARSARLRAGEKL
jgi:16S rRNA (cytosine1402-N4)-methyltransferase